MGARVIPKELGAYLFMDALNISWALEPLDSLRYLVNNRDSTSHQCARVRGCTPNSAPLAGVAHGPNSAPLAGVAHGPNSACCVGQLHGSNLHQQAGQDTVNIAMQMDKEVTVLADVLFRSTQVSGTEWSLHPSVFQAVIRELGIPFLDLFATRWNHKLPISIGHVSGRTTNELEGNVGICLPTSSSVTTSSRESPTRLVRTDPHCLTLTTCNLVSTSHRDVGGFPFTDPQHPSITVATTRTNPSRSLQYTVTHMENIRDSLGSRGFSDLASHASRPQRESTLAIYESKWRIFSTWGITQQVNPLSATESVVSDVLLHLHTEKQLAISTIEGYQLAIANTLRATSDVEVGRNPSLKSLLQNIELDDVNALSQSGL